MHSSRSQAQEGLCGTNAANFAALVNYSDVYMSGARRFDVGKTCMATLPSAIAALKLFAALERIVG